MPKACGSSSTPGTIGSNKIKRCQRLVRLVQLTGPEILLEQGYEVVVDALSRTLHKVPPSRERYLTEVKH